MLDLVCCFISRFYLFVSLFFVVLLFENTEYFYLAFYLGRNSLDRSVQAYDSCNICRRYWLFLEVPPPLFLSLKAIARSTVFLMACLLRFLASLDYDIL